MSVVITCIHVISQLGRAVSLLYKFESKSQTRKSTDDYSLLISAATSYKNCILKLAFLQMIRTQVSLQYAGQDIATGVVPTD